MRIKKYETTEGTYYGIVCDEDEIKTLVSSVGKTHHGMREEMIRSYGHSFSKHYQSNVVYEDLMNFLGWRR